MKYTTRRNISLLISLALMVAALVVFFSLDWPTISNISESSKKLSQVKAKYDEQFQSVQVAKSIINQYKSLSGVSQTISLSVPRGPEIQNVVAQLDNLASQSGLEVQSINFDMPTLSALVAERGDQLAKKNRILNISLSLNGSYESFKTWLSSVESNIRLMDVENISFASLGGATGVGRFNFKVSLSAYYQ